MLCLFMPSSFMATTLVPTILWYINVELLFAPICNFTLISATFGYWTPR